MFRKSLLAALAAATLAGCATGYSYRGGAGGDYYYGQPRTEYRYYEDPYGYYGSFGFGRYAPAYYYDRYGRLVYGSSYGYYGYPYGYGSQWWYRPRPHGNGHGGGDHDHDDHDADRDQDRPPWRNIGGGYPRGERIAPDGDDQRPYVRRQQQMPGAFPSPQRQTVPQRQAAQRPVAPPPPRMRSDDGGGSRMGRALRNARPSSSSED